ncbi:unnamed protein product [Pleuronectes platessa]|uniref:Uncharacterized protein n=1 Tax=Pleuronectes platessa TaxID=8262 RepID=A0A9N7UY51_PLEPL|nr:unnamed protein product [Pleuronectes platessa]
MKGPRRTSGRESDEGLSSGTGGDEKLLCLLAGVTGVNAHTWSPLGLTAERDVRLGKLISEQTRGQLFTRPPPLSGLQLNPTGWCLLLPVSFTESINFAELSAYQLRSVFLPSLPRLIASLDRIRRRPEGSPSFRLH